MWMEVGPLSSEGSEPTSPSPSELRVTVVQMGATHDTQENLSGILSAIKTAAADGSQLIVFPECILSGYMYQSLEEVQAHAVGLDSVEIRTVGKACAEHGVHVVLGLLEAGAAGTVHNSAVMFDSSGDIVTCYRKVHLPFLGADRFVTEGTFPSPIVTTPFGRVGIGICYDLRFPESARAMALSGADIIVQPSTMPHEAELLLEHFVPVRACENRVFVALANRGDVEDGVGFMGRSQIVSPTGRRIAEAEEHGEALLTVTVNLLDAREKRIVNKPGEYEVSLFEDRRPSTYAAITSI